MYKTLDFAFPIVSKRFYPLPNPLIFGILRTLQPHFLLLEIKNSETQFFYLKHCETKPNCDTLHLAGETLITNHKFEEEKRKPKRKLWDWKFQMFVMFTFFFISFFNQDNISLTERLDWVLNQNQLEKQSKRDFYDLLFQFSSSDPWQNWFEQKQGPSFRPIFDPVNHWQTRGIP